MIPYSGVARVYRNQRAQNGRHHMLHIGHGDGIAPILSTLISGEFLSHSIINLVESLCNNQYCLDAHNLLYHDQYCLDAKNLLYHDQYCLDANNLSVLSRLEICSHK